MSPQGRKTVGFSFILFPTLPLVFLIGALVYSITLESSFAAVLNWWSFLIASFAFLLGLSLSGLLSFVTYLTQILVDGTSLSGKQKQAIRYFSFLVYLVLALIFGWLLIIGGQPLFIGLLASFVMTLLVGLIVAITLKTRYQKKLGGKITKEAKISAYGKKIVILSLVLIPSLFIVLLLGSIIYTDMKEIFNIDFLSVVLIRGLLWSGFVILVIYIYQIIIDKTALSHPMQQFIRYLSLVGCLLIFGPMAWGGDYEDIMSLYSFLIVDVGLVIVLISFILIGIGFLRTYYIKEENKK